jgi:hypothetical protein
MNTISILVTGRTMASIKYDTRNNNNSIQFLFICVPTQQPKGELQS